MWRKHSAVLSLEVFPQMVLLVIHIPLTRVPYLTAGGGLIQPNLTSPPKDVAVRAQTSEFIFVEERTIIRTQSYT